MNVSGVFDGHKRCVGIYRVVHDIRRLFYNLNCRNSRRIKVLFFGPIKCILYRVVHR